MSSPPLSLPPATAPSISPPPQPLQPSLPPPSSSPQISPPLVSPFLAPSNLPPLPPAPSSVSPVSSPLPTLISPPPPSVTSSPPPLSITSPPQPSLPSSPKPSPSPPSSPLPSKPTPPSSPKAPHHSPPAKPLAPTPANHSALPPVIVTTSPPRSTAPPPEAAALLPPAASSPEPPLTLPRTLPPSSSSTAATPLAATPTKLPQPGTLFRSPSPSLLPETLQGQMSQPKAAAGLVAGCVIVGVVVVFVLLGIVLVCYKRRSRKNNAVPEEDQQKSPSLVHKDDNVVPQLGVHVIRVLSSTSASPMRRSAAGSEVSYAHQPQWRGFSMDISSGTFTYDQLFVATNGFSEANLLGQGGFGYVYKGVLPGGKEVAVKQLMTGSQQGEREFQAEVDIISRVHHKHLVSLVGHCIKGAERLLVYEFVPNNTLEFHLHGIRQTVLEWEIRLRIATGSAKGLAYLHEDCNPKIIHRDIKASNILMDQNFEAKVCDFGLAKSFSDTNTHITHLSTRVVGTFGYLAPEYASSGKVTEKSDVYSYGVVLLELITGRRPISTVDSLANEGLVQWARPLLTQALEEGVYDGLVDPRLETNFNNNEMAKMVACAAACVRNSAWLRPRMSQIVNALEGVASLMDLREGVTPGNSSVQHNGTGSSYYNFRQYEEDLRNSTVIIASPEYGISGYTETTSEYGLNPSGSSSETRHTI